MRRSSSGAQGRQGRKTQPWWPACPSGTTPWSRRAPGADAYKATGRCFSVAAGRISYTHAFKGARCAATCGCAWQNMYRLDLYAPVSVSAWPLHLLRRTRNQHRHGVLVLAVWHVPAGQHAAAAQVRARPADGLRCSRWTLPPSACWRPPTCSRPTAAARRWTRLRTGAGACSIAVQRQIAI